MNVANNDAYDEHSRFLFKQKIFCSIGLNASRLLPLLPKKPEFIFQYFEPDDNSQEAELSSLVHAYYESEGYKFSWGSIIEKSGLDLDRNELTTCFEFSFDSKIKSAAEAEAVKEFFDGFILKEENKVPPEFEISASKWIWFAFMIKSYGKVGEESLRNWVANKFLIDDVPRFLREYDESIKNNQTT